MGICMRRVMGICMRRVMGICMRRVMGICMWCMAHGHLHVVEVNGGLSNFAISASRRHVWGLAWARQDKLGSGSGSGFLSLIDVWPCLVDHMYVCGIVSWTVCVYVCMWHFLVDQLRLAHMLR